jgi:hypothetical protein
MVTRGPHGGNDYEVDNKEVWQVIRHVAHGGPGWSWVQAFQRVCNGRKAYLSIKTHYLGERYRARIRAQADNTIEIAYFDGKSQLFTFEQYCESLKSVFTDIETTGEEVLETRKVWVLLQGITDTRLLHAKSQVLATPALKARFETALNFIAQFQDEQKLYSCNKTSARNISVAGRGGTHGRSGNTRGGAASGRNPGRGRGGSIKRNNIQVQD